MIAILETINRMPHPELPTEVLQEIFEYTLSSFESPLALLSTCYVFSDIARRIMYSQLRFSSRSQLLSFISTFKGCSVPHAPREIEFDIAGHESNHIFSDLYILFSECLSGSLNGAEKDATGRLALDLLYLRLDSHASDPRLEMIYSSLSLVNPRRFMWTGRGLPHHFSLSIVPRAINPLFDALSTYTNLTELKLTQISMALTGSTHGLPVIPSLKKVYLGQTVFLQPIVVSTFILNPCMCGLDRFNLVDAYSGSIWGQRIRNSDVQSAAVEAAASINEGSADQTEGSKEIIKEMIEKVLICEAKTERIMGGDRVEDTAIPL